MFEKKISISRTTYRYFHGLQFKSIGHRSYIYKPIYLTGTKYISFGNDVAIWHHARIEMIDEWNGNKYIPNLNIGNNVAFGQDLHLTSASRIEIEDNVVCAARVTITDISHITEYTHLSVLQHGIISSPVKICEGVFIGVNATILPGVTIGKYSVIGANSVVTHDVPEYSVVAGIPAKVIGTLKNG